MIDRQQEDGAPRAGAPGVAPPDKDRLVRRVFDTVAGRYDLMNDLMSGGLHRAWKAAMIDWLAPPRSARTYGVLDVAGGTGDIALRVIERGGSGAHVTVCDINPSMTLAGAARARTAGFSRRVDFVTGNAEALPFPDRAFDAYTVAFGMRNVSDVPAALGEAHRVLRPGGRFLCLEFSTVDVPLLDRLYQAYSDAVIPAMGALVVGDADPYRYLVDSIRRFPDGASFAAMIERAGFSRVSWRALSGGIVALHSGWRL